MRTYTTRPFNDIVVDLDNPETYNHLPKQPSELRQLVMSEIGYSFCYMNYWHRDMFEQDNEQKNRIHLLIKYFTENEKNNYDNILWYQEQLFIFQNETENMC